MHVRHDVGTKIQAYGSILWWPIFFLLLND
jgi:hypothetical protein